MIDISLPLDRNLITYPGDARYEQYDYYTHPRDGVQTTRLLMETHTGTHIDAPLHVIDGGKSLRQIPLSKLNGPATVVEVSGEYVGPDDIPADTEGRLLFKTKNSGLYGEFDTSFCYVSAEAAEKIVERKTDLVGIDYLSIEKFGTKGMKVHKILLGNDTIILEGINLKGVSPGNYELVCLPLDLDLDGGPCRAILK